MVQPSGEGAVRCMKQAIAGMGHNGLENPVQYINAHGTSTPIGDIRELEAIEKVFGTDMPVVASTKSLSGHALGAAGVNESIYTLLMMENNFIAASANVENRDEGMEKYSIATKNVENVDFKCAMSNSFGFGGTNCSLVFQKV